MYYASINNGKVIGFYTKNIHGEAICRDVYNKGGLKLNEELWQYILSIGVVELIGIKEDREYTIEDKDLFKEVVQPSIDMPQSGIDLLKEEVLQQSESMLDLDFRLTSLELGL